MSAVLFLFLVGMVTWYAAPAGKDWIGKGWQFVLAFWLPVISWPWLIIRGHKARRQRKLDAEAEEEFRKRQERYQAMQWWMDEFRDALNDRDLHRAELAHDVLETMNPTGWSQWYSLRSRLNAMHAGRVHGS